MMLTGHLDLAVMAISPPTLLWGGKETVIIVLPVWHMVVGYTDHTLSFRGAAKDYVSK